MIKVCVTCKKEFKTKYRWQLNCSNKCRYQYNSGKGNPNYKGAKLTGTCLNCGKDFQYFRSATHGKYCSKTCAHTSKEWRKNISIARIKTWQGMPTAVIKNRLRASAENRNWVSQVFIRDGHRCVKCGSTNKIEAHHLIPFSALFRENEITSFQFSHSFFDVDNGETLCHECHIKTDSYRAGGRLEVRLMNAINKSWQNEKEGHSTSSDFYKRRMEDFITMCKNELP